MVFQSIVREAVRGAWPRKMFSATVNSSKSTVSWWMAVTPASMAACGVREGHRLAVDQDLAFVRAVDAGQDLDEGRFAGAVLADQRGDLARIEGDADVVECLDAREDLRNAAHFENGRLAGGRHVHGRALKGGGHQRSTV